MKKFKGERKQKTDWMYKRTGESQLNTPNTWNGGNYYYCHRGAGGKSNVKYCNHKTSECQVTMKIKLIHLNTSDRKGGDKR